jgi:predicted metalloprotease with PDZ domain
MPAAIMWAHGLDDRPIRIEFVPPPGKESGPGWNVMSQLHPGRLPDTPKTALEYTAPNLQYLMDSPVEFGQPEVRSFNVGKSTFRFSLHQRGGGAALDDFIKDVEKIVREEGAIFGEYPAYEPGSYTFLADYLPYAHGDGMEHRNSTVITADGSIATSRPELLDTVAHEFFHCWNVERIRPKGLEPFDFDRANLSGELWLAEGFTQYYGPLAMRRARLVNVAAAAQTFGRLIESVSQGSGHLVRTAEEMSRMAPFTDGGRSIDRNNWSTTVISYYPYGGAIALALDLTLRDRTDGRLSLDDFMRAMWQAYGKPGGSREGYVDHPYTIADAEATLAAVSGDKAFARDFFARYIQGHDVADYARLLSRAGLTMRRRHPGRAWLGDLQLEPRDGWRVATLIPPTWPIYAAGLDEDDELQQVDGQRIAGAGDIAAVMQRHKPGDRVPVVFVDRTGAAKTASVVLAEDPHTEVVPVDARALTPAQKAFRDRWLGAE